MDDLEEENRELREEVSTLKESLERLNAMIESMAAAQNLQNPQNTVISEVVSAPIFEAPVKLPRYDMPKGFPWGMPINYIPEGYIPPISEELRDTAGTSRLEGYKLQAPEDGRITTENPVPGGYKLQVTEAPRVTAIMSMPPPVVHATPEDQIYHVAPSEGMGVYERMDEFQEQFSAMQKELQAIRGQELFGKDAADLCLVPNVQIPHKFKVPDFEKYKGNSCPQSHLIMYARKMSTQTDNPQLLIHYFQDSLTGAALQWYMRLNRTNIHTFRDLGTAFVQQYKYNLDMAPDRDQLRAMSQKEKETFKEYAQRWREIAAQISPSLEEKELTKIFLKTLSSFYYERMVASAPSDFTEMVNMGVRLEEAVREGRLVRNTESSSSKRYGGALQKKKEQEISNISQGRQRQRYHSQQIATVSPVTSSAPAPAYQPQTA